MSCFFNVKGQKNVVLSHKQLYFGYLSFDLRVLRFSFKAIWHDSAK